MLELCVVHIATRTVVLFLKKLGISCYLTFFSWLRYRSLMYIPILTSVGSVEPIQNPVWFVYCEETCKNNLKICFLYSRSSIHHVAFSVHKYTKPPRLAYHIQIRREGLFERHITPNLDGLWRVPYIFPYRVLQPALLGLVCSSALWTSETFFHFLKD